MTCIVSERLRSFGGPLPRPLQNARAGWTRREGLLYQLVSDDDRTGEGEASPLPDHSRESLEECRARLGAGPAVGLELPPGAGAFPAFLHALPASITELPAAARMAVESALLALVSEGSSLPAWALLAPPGAETPLPRPLAALLHERTPAGIAAEVRGLRERGIACVKLKVGRPGALEVELDLARAVREAAPDLALRLDANRAFTLAEAIVVLERFAPFRCELVEEPTFDLDLARAAAGDLEARRVARALASLPLPVALDESLVDAPAGALAAVACPGFPAAIVLKPTLLGGLSRCLALAAEARAVGADVIVTHTFDGPLALAAAAALALGVGTPGRAMGLARHPGLDAWPARRVPGITQATVVPWSEPGLGVAPLAAEALS